jgi:hypothetical protein
MSQLHGLPFWQTVWENSTDQAIHRVQQVLGLFAAELVVLRGASTPDGLPRHERRLDAEISGRYGPGPQSRRGLGSMATVPYLGCRPLACTA